MGGVGGAAGAGGPSAAGNGSVRSPSAPRPWRLMVSTSPCLSLAGAPTGAWGARTPVPVSHPPGTGSPVGLLLTRRLEGRLGLLTRRLEGRLGLLTRRLEGRLGLLTRRLEGRLGLLTRRLEGRLGLRALSEGL